jgi:hypothetical protein
VTLKTTNRLRHKKKYIFLFQLKIHGFKTIKTLNYRKKCVLCNRPKTFTYQSFAGVLAHDTQTAVEKSVLN